MSDAPRPPPPPGQPRPTIATPSPVTRIAQKSPVPKPGATSPPRSSTPLKNPSSTPSPTLGKSPGQKPVPSPSQKPAPTPKSNAQRVPTPNSAPKATPPRAPTPTTNVAKIPAAPAPTKSPAPSKAKTPEKPPLASSPSKKSTTPRRSHVNLDNDGEQDLESQARVTALTAIYQQHAPEKVSEVKNILKNHKDELPQLFEAIESKYGLQSGHISTQITEELSKLRSGQQQPQESSPKAVDDPNTSPSPPQPLSKIVQQVSNDTIQSELETFFGTHAPDRKATIDELMKEYGQPTRRYHVLFEALQTEFKKPSGYFRKRFAEASRKAAERILQKDLETRSQFWEQIDSEEAKLALLEAQQTFGIDGRLPRIPRTLTFREQLEYFCDFYCPDRANAINKSLRVYRGREKELFEQLHKAYHVKDVSEYVPDRSRFIVHGSGVQEHNSDDEYLIWSADGDKVEMIPDHMRPVAALARHFGLGPQFIPRIMAQHGRDTSDVPRVTFEVLSALFPDAVAQALTVEEQKNAFIAKRVAHFLSFHHPRATDATARIMEQYIKAGRTNDVMADLLVRFHGPVIRSAPVQAFRADDMVCSTPSALINDDEGKPIVALSPIVTLDSQLVSLDRIAPTTAATGSNTSATFIPSETVIRRRHFRRHLEDWFRDYGTSRYSRSTPRHLGEQSEAVSHSTSTADLPRQVQDVGVLTKHREIEEMRLLNLVHRGTLTDPVRFEIRSYLDDLDRQRRSTATRGMFGGGTAVNPPTLRELRNERHRDLYGQHSSLHDHSSSDRTLVLDPRIFLEDDDCSKCKVLQHQLETVTARLHTLRNQQQFREALLGGTVQQNQPRQPHTDPGCVSCDELNRQVRSLSDRLHHMRTHSKIQNDVPIEQPRQRKWVNETRDATVNTDLDSNQFTDLRTYFLLEGL